MHRVNIKPLSVNDAYRGRRFASTALKSFKSELGYLLPKINVPDGKLKVFYRFGVSSRASDADNLCKAFQDCISEQYGFNDNKIYALSIEKIDVKRGEEFIEFEISRFYGESTKKDA